MTWLTAEEKDQVEKLHAVNGALRTVKKMEVSLAGERLALFRALRRGGWSQAEIATEMGISQSRVCKLLQRKG